jgi:hypothetical protein
LLLTILGYLVGVFNGVFDVSFKNFNIKQSVDVGGDVKVDGNVDVKGDINANNVNVKEDINAKNINVKDDINAKNINVEENVNVGKDVNIGGDVVVGGKIVEIDPGSKDETTKPTSPTQKPSKPQAPTPEPTKPQAPEPSPTVPTTPSPEPTTPATPVPELAKATIKFGQHIDGATEIFASLTLSEGKVPTIESNLKYEVVKVNSTVYHIKLYIEAGSHGVAVIGVTGNGIEKVEQSMNY